jgi:hypothetical protein
MRQREKAERRKQTSGVGSRSAEDFPAASDPRVRELNLSELPPLLAVSEVRARVGSTTRNSSNGTVRGGGGGGIANEDDEAEDDSGGAQGFQHSENDAAALAAQLDFEAELSAWVNARIKTHTQQQAAAARGGPAATSSAVAAASEAATGAAASKAAAAGSVAAAVSAEPAHRREAFAAYLSGKYLCARLDPLAKSPVCTAVRRRVARAADALAAGRNPLKPDTAAAAAAEAPASTGKGSSSSSSVGSGGGGSRSGGGSSVGSAWPRGRDKPSAQRHSALEAPAPSSASSSVVVELAALRKAAEKHPPITTASAHGLVKRVGGLQVKGKGHWCTVRDGDWTCGRTKSDRYSARVSPG